MNFLLYLLYWVAFVAGTVVVFRLCAGAVRLMDENMPFGCPPQLRRLTWTLAIVWGFSMFSEGIMQSAYLLDPSFPIWLQADSNNEEMHEARP